MVALDDHLSQLGAASVRVMALTVFSQRRGLDAGRLTFAPGGEWVAGDDAADALAKGWTPAHMAELVRTGELFALIPAPAPAAPASQQTRTSSKTLPPEHLPRCRPAFASRLLVRGVSAILAWALWSVSPSACRCCNRCALSAGPACMVAMAEHLRQLGAASVRVMALTVFSQRRGLDAGRLTFAPGGEWVAGDDAADALAKGWTPAPASKARTSSKAQLPKHPHCCRPALVARFALSGTCRAGINKRPF